MTIFLKVAGAVSLAALMAAPGFAQSSATSSTTATTTIYQPISIANNGLLSFGQIVKPGTAGSSLVTVSAAGVRGLSGGSGTAATLGAGTVTAAAYTATGEGGQSFSISAPVFTMTKSVGVSLAVTPILSSAVGSLSGGFGGPGTGTFTVGGSFTVADTTASGVYSGALIVTVAYN